MPQLGCALVCGLACVFAGAVGVAPAANAAPASPDVIVVGTTQLLWSDVDAARTPTLWKLAGESALGSLSVKAADPVSCAADGWLTLGAGNRAKARDVSGKHCVASKLQVQPAGSGAVVAGFSDAYTKNAHRDDNTKLGALADALTGCVSAAGADAALGAADRQGRVAHYRDDVGAAAGEPAFLQQCPVTLIAATPSTIDGIVASVMANAPANAVLLIVGVAESGASKAHLHVALAHGDDFANDALVSASTRRPPFVQLVDVAPTILSLRGDRIPASMIGQPWRSSGRPSSGSTADEVEKLADLDVAAERQGGAIVPFWVTLVALMVASSAFAWWVARRRMKADDGASARPGPSDRLARNAALACAWCALLPAASFLAGIVSWWSSPKPLPVLALAVVVAATAATRLAVALEGWIWKRRPLGLAAAVGTITFVVIGLDLVTGAHLQIFTMAGYSPLVAGRFAGIGNVAFGVYAAGALLAATGIDPAARRADREAPAARPDSLWIRPGLLAACVGVIAVAIDGAPPWGSDVGGVLALVPAFGVLAFLLAGARVSWRKALAVALGTIAVIVLFALVDYARPPAHQTHLGRFVGDLLHGGAWSIVRRKALADVHLLVYSALTLLIPLLVIVAIWWVRRPPLLLRVAFSRVAVLRPALVALLVMSVVGAVLNDSGIVIPALAAVVVLPATMAVVVATTSPRVPAHPDGGVPEPPPSLLR